MKLEYIVGLVYENSSDKFNMSIVGSRSCMSLKVSPYTTVQTTGAPKLINSDLFLEKRATVHRYCSTFFQKQITINKFWGTCVQTVRSYNSTLVLTRKLILSMCVHLILTYKIYEYCYIVNIVVLE